MRSIRLESRVVEGPGRAVDRRCVRRRGEGVRRREAEEGGSETVRDPPVVGPGVEVAPAVRRVRVPFVLVSQRVLVPDSPSRPPSAP